MIDTEGLRAAIANAIEALQEFAEQLPKADVLQQVATDAGRSLSAAVVPRGRRTEAA